MFAMDSRSRVNVQNLGKKVPHTSKSRNSSHLTPRWLRKESTEVEGSLHFKARPQNKTRKNKKLPTRSG